MRIGIIGAGNMASALADGLLKSGIVSCESLSISDKNAKSLVSWQECRVFVSENNLDVISRSDIIIFAVKPGILPFVLEEAKAFSNDKVFVSIAAGTTISTIESILGDSAKIVRVMPNTPAKVGCGMTVISPNKNIEEAELKMAEEIFSAVGDIVVLEEKHINTATALHGSSPAYVYMLIDAMADAGVKHGLPKSVSLKLSAKAVEGAAKMVMETNEHPQALKDAVCSPGGTTIAAVCELEKSGFVATVSGAVDACIKRADEMSK